MAETLYGHHAVLEALRAGRRRFQQVWLAEGVHQGGDVGQILRLAEQARLRVSQVRRDRLDSLCARANHQGVAAEVSDYPYADWDEIVQGAKAGAEMPLLLLLDRLQDPQNVGTLLRTAEAAGVHGVALLAHRAAGITPAVSNASAGAVEHLRIAQVTNLTQTIKALKGQGVWIVGLERAPGSADPGAVDLNMPLALVVGSEGEGLSRLVRENCDLLLQLPMRGRIGSLNAAVAGSVALYLALQARTAR